MSTRWILFFSAVAFGSAIIFSLPENNNTPAVQSQDDTQASRMTSEHSSTMAKAAAPVFNERHGQAGDSRSRHQTRPVSAQASTLDSQDETDMQAITPDAFPDTTMISADQRAESAATDEAELEAERNAIDLYFPVEEQTAYELSEAEIEAQRQELEQQIAQQEHALQTRSPLSENDFDMPPFEQ